MIICAVLIVVALILVISALLISNLQRPLPLTSTTRCLLLIAHPDDECMFFGPTIVQLVRNGCKLYILCASNGNSEGLGLVRKDELFRSCRKMGISPSRVTLMDVAGLKDGQTKWETEKLARIVLQHVEKLDIEIILTFDDKGVSIHPNHVSCFHAVQFLYSNGMVPSDVQIFVLESVSLIRKYIGFLDIYASFFSSTFIILASPQNSWSAMREHISQLVWFRYLFLIFSRYIVINTWKRIALHKFMISENKKYH